MRQENNNNNNNNNTTTTTPPQFELGRIAHGRDPMGRLSGYDASAINISAYNTEKTHHD